MRAFCQPRYAIAVLCCAAGAISAFAARVEDQVVGPAERLVRYAVSPHGAHLAAVVPDHGKVNVLIDGVADRAFDEIVPVHCSLQLAVSAAATPTYSQLVVFCNDGSRHAYVARLGTDIVLMVDGKELVRVPVTADGPGLDWRLVFTGDAGKHVVFFRGERVPAELWIDGQPKPSINAPGLVASSDGGHYAYPATVDGRPTLVVDGVDAGYAAVQPQFTSDSQHLISIGHSPRGQSLLADGQSIFTTRNIERLQLAPVGSGIIAVATYFYDPLDPMWSPRDRLVVERYAALYPQGYGDFLAINGEPVQPSLGTGAQIGPVIYSADGKRYAAVCTKPNAQYVLLDGKRGWEFAHIEAASLTFSSDSTRVGYIATRDGTRYAAIDGKLSPVPEGTIVLKFSPNAQRMACGGAEVMVDGQPTGLRGAFTFSPDSQHILVAGWNVSDQKTGLYLDGRLVYENSRGVIAWAFSADSQHLYWLASEPDNRLVDVDTFVTYVDGREVARSYDVAAVAALVKAISLTHDTAYGRTSAMWDLEPNGGVLCLGPTGDRVLRVRVYRPKDTTLASLFEPRPPATAVAASPKDSENFSDAFVQLHNQLMQRAAAKDAESAAQPPQNSKP